MTGPLRLAAWLRLRPARIKAASAGILAVSGLLTIMPMPDRSKPTAVVSEGGFSSSLIETGTLTASRLMLYGAPIGSGALKIVEMAPEGTTVAAGDVLIRFDPSGLQNTLTKETAEWARAEAAARAAGEDASIERLEADGQLDAARREITSASSELASEKQGKGQVAVAEAEAAAADADRELARARAASADLRPLLDEGFITRAELERAQQAERRAEEQQRLATLRAESVLRYERPAAVERAAAGVSRAQQSLRRLTETMAARLALRESAVAAAAARVAELRARVEALRSQIARTEVRAERPGLVVYRELYFGQDRRKAQVGDEAWPNQPLIAVPDSTELTVETRVRETDLHRVSRSQRVRVRVEAYPDMELSASVALIGALAQDDQQRAGTRFFPLTVRLLQTDPRLRTGMTARVEIETAAFERAILVPLAAVFDLDGQPYCVVDGPFGDVRKSVTVAAVNDTTAALRDGPAPGTRVLLVDPRAGSR